MASLRKRPSRKPGGKPSWVIEFYPEPNRKREFSVGSGSGKRTENRAREFFRHVEELERAKKLGDHISLPTLMWLDVLDDRARAKLVKVGLVEPRTKRRSAEHFQLAAFVQEYIDMELADNAENTRRNYAQMKNWLLYHFKPDEDVRAITPQDLKRWQRLMATGILRGPNKRKGLALDTRNKHVQRLKTIFAAAVNDNVLRESPAAILKEEPKPKRVDRSREFFVSPELADKVLAGLPDNNWKLIFCLLRYQGFRRNEVFQLEWSHVDWENSRLTVNVEERKKSEARQCPIFPETLPFLTDAFEQAESGTAAVIRWTAKWESLTELLAKQVKRINGESWPKICQQLRSTRRTELEERFPVHVCDEWLGHDNETAKRHYKQVTPAHWAAATSQPAKPPVGPAPKPTRGLRTARYHVGLARPITIKRPPVGRSLSTMGEHEVQVAKSEFTRQLPDCRSDSGVDPEPSVGLAVAPKREKPKELWHSLGSEENGQYPVGESQQDEETCGFPRDLTNMRLPDRPQTLINSRLPDAVLSPPGRLQIPSPSPPEDPPYNSSGRFGPVVNCGFIDLDDPESGAFGKSLPRQDVTPCALTISEIRRSFLDAAGDTRSDSYIRNALATIKPLAGYRPHRFEFAKVQALLAGPPHGMRFALARLAQKNLPEACSELETAAVEIVLSAIRRSDFSDTSKRSFLLRSLEAFLAAILDNAP